MHKDWIAILDFGSQYTHLIARRIRECGVYSEIVPYAISPRELLAAKPKGIILSGGPASVTSRKSPDTDDAMTAHWARLPYEVFEKVSSRITNEVKSVNRVMYDISSKPPSTIEWE